MSWPKSPRSLRRCQSRLSLVSLGAHGRELRSAPSAAWARHSRQKEIGCPCTSARAVTWCCRRRRSRRTGPPGGGGLCREGWGAPASQYVKHYMDDMRGGLEPRKVGVLALRGESSRRRSPAGQGIGDMIEGPSRSGAAIGLFVSRLVGLDLGDLRPGRVSQASPEARCAGAVVVHKAGALSVRYGGSTVDE